MCYCTIPGTVQLVPPGYRYRTGTVPVRYTLQYDIVSPLGKVQYVRYCTGTYCTENLVTDRHVHGTKFGLVDFTPAQQGDLLWVSFYRGHIFLVREINTGPTGG